MAAVILLAGASAGPAHAAPGVPTVDELSVDVVGPTITTLRAKISPNGANTSYRFEYGATSAYGNVIEPEGALIAGNAEGMEVNQPLQGLSPNTVYHYRVVATNTFGAVASEDKTFSTFGIRNLKAALLESDGRPDTQAGSHPFEMTAGFSLPVNTNAHNEPVPAGGMKDFAIELPPGLIGDPSAVPQCPHGLLESTTLGESNCPVDTQVGVMELADIFSHLTLPLYNMVPPPGVAAEFGVSALGPVTLDASVRTGGGYGLTVSAGNLTQVLPLTGTSLTLWGVPADPRHDPYRGQCLTFQGASRGNCPTQGLPTAFITLPTECSSNLTIRATADSWEQPGEFLTTVTTIQDSEGNALPVTGCNRLAFHPTVSILPETSSADSPTGLTIDISQPASEMTQTALANIRDATVTLPEGASINPAMADGLSACSTAQIALNDPRQPTCPDSSKLGTAEVQTPLLSEPLVGSVYLAEPSANPFGSLLAAYVAVSGGGVTVKLPIELNANALTGQLSIELGDLPDLPFTSIMLKLHGGPRAALATPSSCGTFPAATQLTPHAAFGVTSTLTAENPFVINTECNHDFAPSVIAGGTSLIAGRDTGVTLHLRRSDGQQPIESLTAELPPGLLGNLNSVPPCPTVQASNGTCGTESEIGTITLGAGAGSNPFYISGKVYLTAPYHAAPFGLSIVVPAQVGPFNLGTIVVRGQVLLATGDGDLHLVIASDPLPQILDGIPLRLRSVDLTIDRPGFLFNPTSCTPQTITSEIRSTQGAVATSVIPFQVVGCEALSFAPHLTTATEASGTNRGNGASFQMTVTSSRQNQANIRALAITLPHQLQPRLAAAQRACRAARFRTNPASCPRGSLVGDATIVTPAFAVPLTGPTYLVYAGGSSYPELDMVLQGDGISINLAGIVKVSKAGLVSTVFDSLPDVPLSAFTLELPSGPRSMLGATTNVCNGRFGVRYTSIGYNTTRITGTSRMTVRDCRHRRRGGR